MLGASACSGSVVGTNPAATVNGTDISQATVTNATQATKRFYAYSIKKGQDTDGQLAALLGTLEGSGTDTVGTQGAAKILNDLIIDEVTRQALAKAHKLPTSADRKALRAKLVKQVGGEAEFKKFDSAYIELYSERQLLDEAYKKWQAGEADKKVVPLTPAKREAQMRTLYEQTKAAKPLCVNVIQAASEAEAKTARTRVDNGEDFVAVTKDLAPAGTQVPDEGLIGCLAFDEAKAAFAQDFGKVKIGDVIGPVAYTSQQGAAPVYLVLRVTSLTGQTYEQMLPQLEAQVPAKPPATDPTTFDTTTVLGKLLKASDITVDPRFGTWNTRKLTVVPPVVPSEPSKVTTTRKAGSATTTPTTVPATSGG